MKLEKAKTSFKKTINSFKQTLPILIGIIMLVNLSITLIPNYFYKTIFTGNIIIDPIIGGTLGGISAGNPIMSYVIGGELIDQNISLIAITSFILTWVSVGIVQLPAEALMLGKKFAITRNIISFFMALFIALLIKFTLSFL